MHRFHARDHVAQMAFLEIAHRQAQQMRQDAAEPLHADPRGQIGQAPAAQPADGCGHEHGQHEADADQPEQILVVGDEHIVEDPLHVERREQPEQLQDQRQREDLRGGALEAADLSHQMAQRDAVVQFAFCEGGRRRQFQRDAGEVRGQFAQPHAAHAGGGVVDHDIGRRRLRQHHEMIHVPVQDAGRIELRHFFQFDPQRAALQAGGMRVVDQRRQRHAAHRCGEFALQRQRIHLMAMIVQHHRQAGVPALCGFGLQQAFEDGHGVSRWESKRLPAETAGSFLQ